MPRPEGLRPAFVAVFVLLVGLAGCREGSSEPSPSPSSSVSTVEKMGGPIATPHRSQTFEMVYRRPGTLQDAYLVPLINTAKQSVALDRVELVSEKDASSLNFQGAFVAPGNTPLHFTPAGAGKQLTPLANYRLSPTKQSASAPVLVLRIGPALAADTEGFRFSRNNTINLHYHTASGQRYDAVYPIRVEYPN